MSRLSGIYAHILATSSSVHRKRPNQLSGLRGHVYQHSADTFVTHFYDS